MKALNLKENTESVEKSAPSFLTNRIYTPWNNQLAPYDITVEKEIPDLEI